MLWGLFHPASIPLTEGPIRTRPPPEGIDVGSKKEAAPKKMAKNAADVAAAGSTRRASSSPAPGLRFDRHFTPPGSHAYDLVEWERRTASIIGEKGQVIFEQKDVEVPRSWWQQATKGVAQK